MRRFRCREGSIVEETETRGKFLVITKVTGSSIYTEEGEVGGWSADIYGDKFYKYPTGNGSEIVEEIFGHATYTDSNLLLLLEGV